MGQHVLVITGADSSGYTHDYDLGYVFKFDSFNSARDCALQYEQEWIDAGYRLAPSGLYIQGPIWRRCALIDDHGMQWFLGGVGNPNGTIKSKGA